MRKVFLALFLTAIALTATVSGCRTAHTSSCGCGH
jgi:hypothetical protein